MSVIYTFQIFRIIAETRIFFQKNRLRLLKGRQGKFPSSNIPMGVWGKQSFPQGNKTLCAPLERSAYLAVVEG